MLCVSDSCGPNRAVESRANSSVVMSSPELVLVREENETLVNANRRLREMLALTDKFRVLLIAMVNNCRCQTESCIRVKFNLLMEDYYQLNDRRDTQQPNDQTLNYLNCNQIDINSVVDSLLTDKPLEQTDDNVFVANTDQNQIVLTEIVDISDQIDGHRRQQRQKHFHSMTKADDGRDLELKERVARLKKYVARPKIYSRMSPARVRPDQSFECSWPGCESVFKAKVDLKTHLAFRHMGEKPYRCDWPGCDKRFPVKRNLARHRETHEGVKHYECDWPGCEYKSWYPQGVRAHRKRHTDERPHRCQWPSCEWTFRQSHHLKAHMLKHTGEKPFDCTHPGCDQRFQSRQAMKFHLDRTHRKT